MKAAPVFMALALCAACGRTTTPDGLFDLSWRDDGGAAIERVRQRVSAEPVPKGPDLAVFVTASGLVGELLPGGARWAHPARARFLPVVSGSVVIVGADKQITALDASTGSGLWSIDLDYSTLVGAADDGKLSVLSVLSRAGSELLAVDRQGDVVLRSPSASSLGVPAVLGGTAFVPWGNQFVSAIDLESGEETGRLLARQQVSRAVRLGANLYFGELAYLRFDEAISGASEGRAHAFQLPTREVPGAPTWRPGGTLSLGASARTHIQAYALPAEIHAASGSDVERSFAGERYATTYFGVALGFHTKTGKLMWVRSFSSDIVGGAATEHGFVFCTERGTVEYLAGLDGARLDLSAPSVVESRRGLGESVQACAVQADTLKFPPRGRAESLADQAAEALATSHPELAAVHAFLLGELAKEEDPLATKILIDVASSPRTAPSLREQAAFVLEGRRTGSEHMLAALEREYDFLADVLSTPPVGALASALMAMNERRAAPFLARHLNAPETSSADLEKTARALRTLAGQSELSELETFFSLYRATADDDTLVNAVVFVAEALLSVGGADGRRIVQSATEDTLTHPAIKEKLGALMGKKNPSPRT